MANQIHPTAILEGDISLGEGNKIGPYAVLYGPLAIGDHNEISPHVTIGTPGQDTRNPRYDSSNSPIFIGNFNNIREFSTIQKPCYREETRIEDDVFIMHGVHVPHDAHLETGVVLTPACAIGGIARIMRHATLGMGATIHQYSIVGAYSIVATGSAVTKNVKPFSRYIPSQPISINQYALEKYGFESNREEIAAYLHDGIAPVTPKIQNIVAAYTELHKSSGRGEY